ncbi:hypothetical protein ACWCW7_22235 [Nocardia tengchongensis]
MLAVLGVMCFAVGAGWILESERITMLAALVLTMSAVLITGFVVDHRAAGRGRLPVRGRAAVILAGAAILVTTFFGGMLILAMNGQRASVPSVSELRPLPAGLVVLDNHSQGCGGNSSTVCGRIFEVGSTGIAGSGSAAALVEHPRAVARLAGRDSGPHARIPVGAVPSCRLGFRPPPPVRVDQGQRHDGNGLVRILCR